MAKSIICQHVFEHEGWPENELCPDCYFSSAASELDKVWGLGERELDLFYSRRECPAKAFRPAPLPRAGEE